MGLGEFTIIERHFRPLTRGFPGALKLLDDVALIEAKPGHQILVTADALVAGVHFRPGDQPGLIARKAVRVNLSDLAAKGARPVALFMTACFPSDVTESWLTDFAQGMAQDLALYDVPLAGGDTVATPGPLTLSLTALGEVQTGRALLRSGARAHDGIWVSSTLGDGALGLEVLEKRLTGLSQEHAAFLADRYLLPQPRLALGQALQGIATAAMDISDGLAGDIAHIAKASGLAAMIETAALPMSPAGSAVIEADSSRFSSVLGGGDDYELLFTAPMGRRDDISALGAKLGLPLTLIGRMEEGAGVKLVDRAGALIDPVQPGYRHF
jgi:thiamine-monophosphate kinase